MKPQYSAVGPSKLLGSLQEYDMLGGYQLFLAHDVVANEWRYKKLAKEVRSNERKSIIILDNSLIELGGAVDLGVMLRAANYVAPNYIVMPDVLLEMDQSIKAFRTHYAQWAQLCKTIPGCQLMAVVQGKTSAELEMCAEAYVQADQQDCLGALAIPRAFENTLGGGYQRARVADVLFRNFGMPIHMLGFSEYFRDDMEAARTNGVMGIDSATPLRAGFENLKYSTQECWKQIRVSRPRWFDLAANVNYAMAFNIGFIRGLLDVKRL